MPTGQVGSQARQAKAGKASKAGGDELKETVTGNKTDRKTEVLWMKLVAETSWRIRRTNLTDS